MEVKGCIAKNLKNRLSNHFIYCPDTIDIITNGESSKKNFFHGSDKVAAKKKNQV